MTVVKYKKHYEFCNDNEIRSIYNETKQIIQFQPFQHQGVVNKW